MSFISGQASTYNFNLSDPNYVRIEQLTSQDSENNQGCGILADRTGIPEIYTMVGITQY